MPERSEANPAKLQPEQLQPTETAGILSRDHPVVVGANEGSQAGYEVTRNIQLIQAIIATLVLELEDLKTSETHRQRAYTVAANDALQDIGYQMINKNLSNSQIDPQTSARIKLLEGKIAHWKSALDALIKNNSLELTELIKPIGLFGALKAKLLNRFKIK